MSPDVSSFEQELSRRVDEVLHYIWDPLRVSGVPEARDEYDSYVRPTTHLLLRGATEQTLVDHLAVITSSTIGISTNLKNEKEAAESLIDWYEFLRDRHA